MPGLTIGFILLHFWIDRQDIQIDSSGLNDERSSGCSSVVNAPASVWASLPTWLAQHPRSVAERDRGAQAEGVGVAGLDVKRLCARALLRVRLPIPVVHPVLQRAHRQAGDSLP
jgi:hypothetical protein